MTGEGARIHYFHDGFEPTEDQEWETELNRDWDIKKVTIFLLACKPRPWSYLAPIFLRIVPL